MFFTLSITAFCLVELFATKYLFWGGAFWGGSFDINLMSGTLMALAMVTARDTQRDRSVAAVIAAWWVYCLVTDKVHANETAISMEASIMVVAVFWALARPYFFASQNMTPYNVTLVFYQGRNAPILSELSSLVGLPFSSVGVIARGKILRAKKDGFLHMTDSRALNTKDYVFVDTGIKATPEHIAAMNALSGAPVKRLGLRMGCIAALLPLLKDIDMAPKTKFHMIPSVYYYQCAGKSNG